MSWTPVTTVQEFVAPARLLPGRTTGCPAASSQAITRRTVRSLMLTLRSIVAADSQHPVPSSREHASANVSGTRRSLPEVGEFAYTQFVTAMLIASASRMSDSGTGQWGRQAPLRRRHRDRNEVAELLRHPQAADMGHGVPCSGFSAQEIASTSTSHRPPGAADP